MSDARATETWKNEYILQKLWKVVRSVSCYMDRLLANQIAEKPVRISCHEINTDTKMVDVKSGTQHTFAHLVDFYII